MSDQRPRRNGSPVTPASETVGGLVVAVVPWQDAWTPKHSLPSKE